jgi:hypothetical protein
MTQSKPLSSAAQAVLDAANGRSSYGPDDCLNESRWIAAAALRAAADQPYKVPAWVGEDAYWTYVSGVGAERERNRSIAAELEGEQ